MNQVIKYKWSTESPFFSLRSKDKIELFGNNFSIKLGEKTCVGYRKNGKHRPCPENKKTDYNRQCKSCQEKDDYFGCIKCVGECINPKQRSSCMKNDYCVYLVSFGPMLKIGISIKFRVMQRLREQGADFGAIVKNIKDGKKARKFEQGIKRDFKITDRIYGEQKERHLLSDPNVSANTLKNGIEKIQEKLDQDPQIYDLRSDYGLETITETPKHLQIKDYASIEGKFVAAKGNILVLENGNYHTINAHRVIGRKWLVN